MVSNANVLGHGGRAFFARPSDHDVSAFLGQLIHHDTVLVVGRQELRGSVREYHADAAIILPVS
jgi:hypothetical protein